jgi:hypothetical protein
MTDAKVFDLQNFLSSIGQDLSKALTNLGVNTSTVQGLLSGGKKTVFLPTTSVFASLPKDLTAQQFLQILKLHVVDGYLPAADIPVGETVVPTAAGVNVTAKNSDGKVSVMGPANTVNVTTPNQLVSSNVVVHAVDGLLLPYAPQGQPYAAQGQSQGQQNGLSSFIGGALNSLGIRAGEVGAVTVGAAGVQPGGLTVLPVVVAAPNNDMGGSSGSNGNGWGWLIWLIIIVVLVILLWYLWKRNKSQSMKF